MANEDKVLYEDDRMAVFINDAGVVKIHSRLVPEITAYVSVEDDGSIEMASSTPMVITDEGAVRTIVK